MNSESLVSLQEVREIPACPAMVVGLPGLGLASILASGYLREQLRLPMCAMLRSRRWPLRCVIDEGVPSHCVKIFGDANLAVATSDVKVPMDSTETAWDLVDRLVSYAQQHRCRLLVCVEGEPVGSAQQMGPRGGTSLEAASSMLQQQEERIAEAERLMQAAQHLKFVSTDPTATEVLTSLGFTRVNSGFISGAAGGLLAECGCRNFPVVCLLSPADPAFPEAFGALSVVRAINAMMNALFNGPTVDTTKLEEKAKSLHRGISTLLDEEKARSAAAHLEQQHVGSLMYS